MEPRTEREKFTSAKAPILDSPENAERLESTLASKSKSCPRPVRQFVNSGREVRVIQSTVSTELARLPAVLQIPQMALKVVSSLCRSAAGCRWLGHAGP
jgi:hypothetical protein